MGEKEGAKNDGEKKSAAGDANAIVMKMDLHCDGCARKVKKLITSFEGVGNVSIDVAGGKLTVTGKPDPEKLRQRLEDKTHKKVELVSSPAKKKDGEVAGDKKTEEKKKPVEATEVLKIKLHCEGCMNKIKKVISKINGVQSVTMDAAKDLVTIKGTMDMKDLTPYLQEKFKRTVEVVTPKKDATKEKSGGGGDKKKADDGGKAKGEDDSKKNKAVDIDPPSTSPPKMEISRMEYHGTYSTPPPPMYWYGQPIHGEPPYGHYMPVPYQYHEGQTSQGYYPPVPYGESSYSMDPRVAAPHSMFSDEDPNAACSIM
ncbi:hypothetical protein SAY86_023792 [Trapa natans]|uniref:HMA domain-containing protein n=1 Tax=Trapa natans TaxID=22666 RepID=A0AAN7M7Y2_TRANT|nr:hypothetical protein SAY86_023792 [Trapa natans]